MDHVPPALRLVAVAASLAAAGTIARCDDRSVVLTEDNCAGLSTWTKLSRIQLASFGLDAPEPAPYFSSCSHSSNGDGSLRLELVGEPLSRYHTILARLGVSPVPEDATEALRDPVLREKELREAGTAWAGAGCARTEPYRDCSEWSGRYELVSRAGVACVEVEQSYVDRSVPEREGDPFQVANTVLICLDPEFVTVVVILVSERTPPEESMRPIDTRRAELDAWAATLAFTSGST